METDLCAAGLGIMTLTLGLDLPVIVFERHAWMGAAGSGILPSAFYSPLLFLRSRASEG